MEEKTLIIIADKESSTKKRLLSIIKKRKMQLMQLKTQFELLQLELEAIKREYYFRVGKLIMRDNELDLQIISHKNILSLLKQGLSYKEAVETIKNMFYSEESADKADEVFEDYASIALDNTSEDAQKLKTLWKKAVMKFHPDLVTDPTEKKLREGLMKQVNNAYAAQDYATLETIYTSNDVIQETETDLEALEQSLINLENIILKTRADMGDLKKTEWFSWKKKLRIAKKKGEDVFKELEDALLDDVIKKARKVADLKQAIDALRTSV
jgi:hypothetical protein